MGVVHPDILLPQLTFEQWLGWSAYYEQEPWGEMRADMRGAAQDLVSRGVSGISLLFPYWQTPEQLDEEVKRLKATEVKHNTPEHQAKLIAARKQHRELTKRGG